jgi:hypothetical protein
MNKKRIVAGLMEVLDTRMKEAGSAFRLRHCCLPLGGGTTSLLNKVVAGNLNSHESSHMTHRASLIHSTCSDESKVDSCIERVYILHLPPFLFLHLPLSFSSLYSILFTQISTSIHRTCGLVFFIIQSLETGLTILELSQSPRTFLAYPFEGNTPRYSLLEFTL